MTRLAWLLAFAAVPAFAQLKLGCRLTPSTAMLYEPVTAEITIQNDTGADIDSSTGGNLRVSFEIRDQVGTAIRRIAGSPVELPLRVPAAQTLTFNESLSRQYDLGRPGAYTIQLRVEWGEYVFKAENRYLDVVPGIEITRLTAGAAGGTRSYTLSFLNRDKHDRLFLRIDDETRSYGVFDLGRLVRMTPPEMRADAGGRLHILHQSAPQRFTYSVFSPDGQMVEQKTFGDPTTRVTMKAGSDGAIDVEEVAVQSQSDIRPLDSLPSGARPDEKKR
jgi:hypothetical protein